MKKAFIIIIAVLSLLLTACGKNDGSSEISQTSTENTGGDVTPIGNVKEVTENYNSDFELCKNTEYVNLDWTYAEKCPVNTISEIYNIEWEKAPALYERPADEILNCFEKYCREIFGEYEDDFALFEQKDFTEEFPKAPEEYVNGQKVRGYYKISDYKDKILDGSIEVCWLIYRNYEKKQYMWWPGERYPWWINKGAAFNILDADKTLITGAMPSDLGAIADLTASLPERYYNDGKSDDVKYKLADGEVSIGDAIKYFTEEYPKSLPFEEKPSLLVNYVDVYELKDGIYAYVFAASCMYNSVPIERTDEISANFPIPNYSSISAEGLMIKSEDIDMSYCCMPLTNISVVGEPIAKILSLKKAVDTASEQLTQKVKFNVLSTEFIYNGVIKDDGSCNMMPTWEFRLYNENDALYYTVYVDAVSGECSYYKYSIV
ncbi:MAG: PepSY domain-containing protein [Lachnospiraceae bacterium]|nr:PepSY domain-containing protein [Ruminococcus sp.]MCM1276623.1 PepSY domain-containing protein [Lachnospiraceae bacterium]